MIDYDELECETLNCLFNDTNEDTIVYQKSYKNKHKEELNAINTSKQKSRKELTNESITYSKRSSMDK